MKWQMPNKLLGLAAAGLVAGAGYLALPQKTEAQGASIRIAYVDPLSGPMAGIGDTGLKNFQFILEEINAKGGANGRKLEIVPYDNKLNAQETIVQVQKAIDDGIRIITQGNGTSFAIAISEFVTKYNERNPGKEVVYLNYAAVDPILTNDKCSYWHFRWDANTEQKMAAITTFMKDRKNVKKVYLINQDYAFGHGVRDLAVKMVKEKRPDVEIVGNEVHPLAKVTDFAPYIAKIKASGADAVITGNWGSDFALLVKAAADAGLQVDWYTFYAGGTGGPTAMKQANLPNRIFAVGEGFANIPHKESIDFEKGLRAKYGVSLFYPRGVNQMRMLAAAITQAKSDDPKRIAAILHDMKFEVFHGGQGYMRADDHQFMQPLYLASFGPIKADQPFDEEKTGWGWTIAGKVDLKETVVPTTCKMNKPS
jgi:branched-chain amino acid transport system substrate-binding protein